MLLAELRGLQGARRRMLGPVPLLSPASQLPKVARLLQGTFGQFLTSSFWPSNYMRENCGAGTKGPDSQQELQEEGQVSVAEDLLLLQTEGTGC